MKSLTDVYTLSNGVTIPCVGFGTWQTPDGDVAVSSVKAALAAGYRHIDTAAVYGNEGSVGRGLVESGVDRKDIFVTTKLWNSVRGYEQTKEAFAESMEKLGLSVLDLYLIHWPNPAAFRNNWEEANAESWRAMEDLYKEGKIRAIGVSNFLPHHFEALLKTAKVVPMVNQIRLFPGFPQRETVSFCKKHNVLVQAYSPLGTGKLLSAETLLALAKKYGKSPAQVALRWSLQMGFNPLPKSVTPSRIEENTKLFDFSLSNDDMEILTGMENPCGVGNHPDHTSF